jgi:hypothetical protein
MFLSPRQPILDSVSQLFVTLAVTTYTLVGDLVLDT